MSTEEVLSALLKVSAASEAYEVTSFQVVRHDRLVHVAVLDAGTAAAGERYTVEVHAPADDSSGEVSLTSNPARTIDEALRGVHWKELDR
ncbi:hypothetical protein [Kribbella sp. CA-294648]|uniref:hypothetical protein n=1 Tax=Kribbella sp. CA-294648 TaxID=3239948 RepID=UPI003D8D1D8E